MSLFGLIGSVISGVGSFISTVGQDAGNEALANLGSSIGSFGETVSSWGQVSPGGDTPGTSSQATDQAQAARGSAPAEMVKTVKPITLADIAETQPSNLIDEIRLEAYKALIATPVKMPTYSEYRYDERFQEAQLVLKTMGIGQYTTWEQWAARFAWWQWQEDDPVLLEAVKEWWLDRGQADYIARDAALMASFETVERERKAAEKTDRRTMRRVRFARTRGRWQQEVDDAETALSQEEVLANLVAVQEEFDEAARNWTRQDYDNLTLLNNMSDQELVRQGRLDERNRLKAESEQRTQLESQRNEVLFSLFGWEEDSSALDNLQGIWGQVNAIQQQQLGDRFGITIAGYDWAQADTTTQPIGSYNDLVMKLEAIYRYQQGAETVATWLIATFPTEFQGIEANEAFRQTFGPITVNRTQERPENVNEDAKAFTHGDMIDDYFDNFGRTMTSENFVHELFHVFVNEGEARNEQNKLDFGVNVSRENLESLPQAMFDILETSEVSDEARQGIEQPGRGVFAPNEIVANFLAADALGYLNLSPSEITELDRYDYRNRLEETLEGSLSHNSNEQ